jgi:hypothetical protein
VNLDDVRREIKCLEDERLRLAPEVMGGDREAVERDRDLERRIMDLAGSDRETRADELREAWRRRHPGEDE